MSEQAHRERRLILAVLFGIVNRCASILQHGFIVAAIIPYFGAEVYGVWTTANAMVAWMALGNFGLGLALITQLSNEEASIDKTSLITSTFVTLTGASLLMFALAWLLIQWFPMDSWMASTTLEPAVIHQLSFVAIFTAAGMLFLSIGHAVLQGQQRGDLSACAASTGIVTSIAVNVVHLQLQPTIFQLALTLSLLFLLPSIFQCVVAIHFRYLKLQLGKFRLATAIASLRLGLQFLWVSSCNLLFNQSGSVIVAGIAGPVYVTAYDIMARLSMTNQALIGTFVWPLWPSLGDAFAKGDLAWIRKITRLSFLIALTIWAAVSTGLILAGMGIITWVVGSDFQPTSYLIFAFVAQMFVMTLYMPLQAILSAAKVLRPQMITAGLQVAAFLAIAIPLCFHWQAAAIPTAQALALGFITVPILTFYTRRLFKSNVIQPTS